jgi:hypothetical protein
MEMIEDKNRVWPKKIKKGNLIFFENFLLLKHENILKNRRKKGIFKKRVLQ